MKIIHFAKNMRLFNYTNISAQLFYYLKMFSNIAFSHFLTYIKQYSIFTTANGRRLIGDQERLMKLI